MLCLSQNQTEEVLAADYQLTANVTFDINFAVTKTYQDFDGNENAAKDFRYSFIKRLDLIVNSNSEDWDGNGSADVVSTEGWIPIGSSSNPFTGNFDGGGNNIVNLYVNRPSENYQGLFGYTNDSRIAYLELANSYVAGNSWVGGISGRLNSGILEQVYSNYNNIVATISQVGSIAGYSESYIANCRAIGNNVIGTDQVGGLVGSATDTITDSFSITDVYGSSNSGGLAGSSSASSVERSFALGNVLGTDQVGGLLGYSSSAISNSRSEGTVAGNSLVGGLVGSLNGGSITESYTTGWILGVSSIGGLVGRSVNSSISDNYTSGDVWGDSVIGGLIGYADNSPVINNYAKGTVDALVNRVGGLIGYFNNNSITNSYATGEVIGGSSAGGLVGYIDSSSTITNSYAYYSIDPSGTSDVGALVGGINSGIIINNTGDKCEQIGTLLEYTCNNGNAESQEDIEAMQDNWTASDWRGNIGTGENNLFPELVWQIPIM